MLSETFIQGANELATVIGYSGVLMSVAYVAGKVVMSLVRRREISK